MDKRRYFVKVFKALANLGRIDLLMEMVDGEKNVTELIDTLQQKQSSVSHNLHKLIDAGLVHSRQQGAYRYYSLDEKSAGALVRAMHAYPNKALPAKTETAKAPA